jgi:hypothetical protein
MNETFPASERLYIQVVMEMNVMHRAVTAVIAFLCLTGLLTACMQSKANESQRNDPALPNAETPDDSPVAAMRDGILIQKDEANKRWLITENVEENGSAYVHATWFTLRDDSELIDEQGAVIHEGVLQVGQRAEVWSVGPVKESYPQQASLAKLVLKPQPSPQDTEMIDIQTAVQTALNESGPTRLWSVKAAEWDAERKVWSVELAEGGQTDQTVTVYVDGASGVSVPAVLMENDAFRLFGPAPESEVGSTFTVTGEARVFEAAFGWKLEDGHSVLAEGHAMADRGAPDWGAFEFEVRFEKATNPVLTLILYVGSPKDGTPEHELFIPLKPKAELLDYSSK